MVHGAFPLVVFTLGLVLCAGFVYFARDRGGVDEEGNYKKQTTFLHRGGVQEFVELMCKDKQLLHPEMKVGLLLCEMENGGHGSISGVIPRPGWTGSSARKVTRNVVIDVAALYGSTGTALEFRAASLFDFTLCKNRPCKGGSISSASYQVMSQVESRNVRSVRHIRGECPINGTRWCSRGSWRCFCSAHPVMLLCGAVCVCVFCFCSSSVFRGHELRPFRSARRRTDDRLLCLYSVSWSTQSHRPIKCCTTSTAFLRKA